MMLRQATFFKKSSRVLVPISTSCFRRICGGRWGEQGGGGRWGERGGGGGGEGSTLSKPFILSTANASMDFTFICGANRAIQAVVVLRGDAVLEQTRQKLRVHTQSKRKKTGNRLGVTTLSCRAAAASLVVTTTCMSRRSAATRSKKNDSALRRLETMLLKNWLSNA
jgi:hypothetical protein